MSICGCLGYGKGWGTITQVLQSHCILYAAILYHALAYKMPSISDQTVENCFNWATANHVPHWYNSAVENQVSIR